MFVNIGFGNFINSSQIVSICRADSAPMKRMVSEARSKGSAVDATQGQGDPNSDRCHTGKKNKISHSYWKRSFGSLSAHTRDAYRQM